MRVIGRYTVQHAIGSGGMATVYLGKLRGPIGFSPVVAVKALHPQYAAEPEFVQMFLDEARVAARVRHPNIVPVIDAHADGGELVLVLEYIHGESLAALLASTRREGQTVPAAIASSVIGDLLHGLHAAHEACDEQGQPLGIVHRDVSPQNVMVGVDGVARVLDFGIAKAAGRVTTTRDGEVKGKLAYMAPEQLRGEELNRQADLYGAAVVLWETLTCKRLFKADSAGNVVTQVLFGRIAPPSEIVPGLPPALDAVVLRGLSRDRARRFTTAKEMALALHAAVPPASSNEVSEWVEARAFEFLERRARARAELERVVAEGDLGSARQEISGPLPELAPVPPSLTESTGTLGTIGTIVKPPPVPQPRPGRTAALGLVALLAVAATSAWAGARLVRTAASAEPPPPAAPAPPPPSAESLLPPAGVAPAEASPSAPPTAEPHATLPTARGAPRIRPTTRRVAGAAASDGARCARRNAEGVIEFDTACLREGR